MKNDFQVVPVNGEAYLVFIIVVYVYSSIIFTIYYNFLHRNLKGLSHETDLDFDDMYGLF